MEKWLEMTGDARGVIFDFGGVLAYPPGTDWAAYATAERLGLSRAAFDRGFRAYRHLWDGGFIPGREMYRRIFSDNDLSPSDREIDHLLAVDCEGWVHRFNPDTLALMKALKAQGRKLGILTNMSAEFKVGWFLPRAKEYVDLVDAMVVSGDHRLYKPQLEIYRLMEAEIGLGPNELFYFDDNQPNVDGAIAAGWRAARYF